MHWLSYITLNKDIYGDLLVRCLWSVMREFAYNTANIIISSKDIMQTLLFHGCVGFFISRNLAI